MYVCVCNAVSERAIREAVEAGARTFEDLQMQTGCSTCCGCCEPVARHLLDQYLRLDEAAHPAGGSPQVLAVGAVSR